MHNFRSCCFCCWDLSLKTGTILIGCAHVILAFSQSIIVSIKQANSGGHSWSNDEVIIFAINISVSVGILITSILLVVGSIKRKELLLLPFLALKFLAAVAGIFVFYGYLGFPSSLTFENVVELLGVSFVIIFLGSVDTYLVSVVISNYRKLKADKLVRKNADIATTEVTLSNGEAQVTAAV